MFQIETISAKMLDYYVERSDAVIIDLRDSAAYRRGHVRNAVNIPYRELEEYLEKKQDQKYRFPKDKLLIFYCDRGGASMQAARIRSRAGCHSGHLLHRVRNSTNTCKRERHEHYLKGRHPKSRRGSRCRLRYPTEKGHHRFRSGYRY